MNPSNIGFLLLSLLLSACSDQQSNQKKQINIKEQPSHRAQTSAEENVMRQFSWVTQAPDGIVKIPDLHMVIFSKHVTQARFAHRRAASVYRRLIAQWFSWHPKQGLLTQLNQALQRGDVMHLDRQQIDYLKQLKDLSIESLNRFNPTIGHIQVLWQFSKYRNGALPITPPLTKQLNRAAAYRVSGDEMRFSHQGVYSENNHLQLELYSTIKGHIIEQIFHALLPLSAIKWAKIQIGKTQKIINPQNDFIYPISAEDMGLNTNVEHVFYLCHGDSMTQLNKYDKFINYQGKRYHHIIDPHTARPVQTTLTSLAIFSDDAVRAEAAVVAAYVAGERWKNTLMKMHIPYAIFGERNQPTQMNKALSLKLQEARSRIRCLINN